MSPNSSASQRRYSRCLVTGSRDSLPVCARTRSYSCAFPYCGTVSHPYFPSAHRGQRRYHVKSASSWLLSRIILRTVFLSRSLQWPRGLTRRSWAARLLRLWVRISPRAWMFVCCACCVLSGRGICDGLITCPEESYRLWRVIVCDLETSKRRRLKPATGL
jgi:hypothetical protein